MVAGGIARVIGGSFATWAVVVGPQAPAGWEGNWLQTIPGKSWFAAFRMYAPEQAWIDQTWRPGEIELVK